MRSDLIAPRSPVRTLVLQVYQHRLALQLSPRSVLQTALAPYRPRELYLPLDQLLALLRCMLPPVHLRPRLSPSQSLKGDRCSPSLSEGWSIAPLR
jgi:hypothetical protein